MTNNKTDLAAITEVIEDYFQGMYQSDGARLRRAFHANARIAGHGSDGGFNELTVEQFARFAEKQQPSAAAKGEPYDMAIVTIDIVGVAAVVKVADAYIGRDFTDYLSLLQVDGKWVIYGKIWHAK
jgi:hypothetical protein